MNRPMVTFKRRAKTQSFERYVYEEAYTLQKLALNHCGTNNNYDRQLYDYYSSMLTAMANAVRNTKPVEAGIQHARENWR